MIFRVKISSRVRIHRSIEGLKKKLGNSLLGCRQQQHCQQVPTFSCLHWC